MQPAPSKVGGQDLCFRSPQSALQKENTDTDLTEKALYCNPSACSQRGHVLSFGGMKCWRQPPRVLPTFLRKPLHLFCPPWQRMKERKPYWQKGVWASRGGKKKSEPGNFRPLRVWNRPGHVPWGNPDRSCPWMWSFGPVLSLWGPAETNSLGGAPLPLLRPSAKLSWLGAGPAAGCLVFIPSACFSLKANWSPGCLWHVWGSWPGSLWSVFGFALQVRELKKASCFSHQHRLQKRVCAKSLLST